MSHYNIQECIAACYAVPGTQGVIDAATEELLALLRRNWAVLVLDTFAEENPHRCYRTLLAAQPDLPDTVTMVYDHVWVCTPFPTKIGNTEQRFARTPDAARHAAAEAVFPTLSAKAKARIGRCPCDTSHSALARIHHFITSVD